MDHHRPVARAERDPTDDAPTGIEVTPDVVISHQWVDDLPEPHRSALIGWLEEHHLDPASIPPHTAIERDTSVKSVTWREDSDDGVLVHRRFPPIPTDEYWPLPFPDALYAAPTTPSADSP